ncbi:helix-turn-helix transcriptional regulator [Haloflavibacter putidus]|uniref:Helix-turn-helix domain-containing protein n=1 Tax=Haloflavibacter putidus TaxID=2576776 RepID=A0A507ZRP2_9FLAO|nr:helix-turn-helix domain-containing protein [Haloflavibacter putidus]TQD40290.1 helix-turn-helix domain-containing protein [Haloflavibacter putidus]
MLPKIAKIKGIHPGLILLREIKRNNIKSSQLAMAIGEHKQTISAIINQKRGINPELSIKLADYFHIEEDYFMMLQAGYEVKSKLTEKSKGTPNLNNIRKVLFWDTSFDKIDWNKNKSAIIKRVLERGNDKEINEIIKFYGKKTVSRIAKSFKQSRFSTFQKNVEDFQLI